jgi:hypothetical protein
MTGGMDTYIVATGAGAAELEALPRQERVPPLIHLVDIDRTEHVGHMVQTDIVIAGVGETFHVPRAWKTNCTSNGCTVCPKEVDIGTGTLLLAFCRISKDQATGLMRRLAGGCEHRPSVTVTGWATITELLALPVARPDDSAHDYREKVIALVGPLQNSNIRYRATGEVIAEPKRQRASMLVQSLERLQSAADGFQLTDEIRDAFRVFRSPDGSLDQAEACAVRIAATLTRTVTKIHGHHRQRVLLAELLAYHSIREIPWDEEKIKGTIDLLVVGDTGQGKTTQVRRLMEATGLGQITSGSTSSRAGVLYSLDSKVNDKRILRWGAFPLAHGELLIVDEAQNIPREQWQEFTTARSEGVLKVDRSIRAEHPSRVRLLCFANPVGRASMAEYQYGIMAVHPEHGMMSAQDLRRFDLVGVVAEGDEARGAVLGDHPPAELAIPPNLLRHSVLWAWTRTAEHVQYAPETEQAIKALATALQDAFGAPEIPLLITDAHEKVARLATAFAALLHSTDQTHERIIVTPTHIGLVGRLMDKLYTHPNCALDSYATVLRRRGGLLEGEYEMIAADLLCPGSNREDTLATESMLELFLAEDDISRPDLEAATGLGKDGLSRRLGKLRKHRLVQSGKRGYRKSARFVVFLRKWSEARESQGDPPRPPASAKPPNPSNQTGFCPAGGVS